MRRTLRNNGLSIVLFALALACLAGQAATGLREYNDDRAERRQPAVALGQYLATGHFVEAVFENWESEFLQMAAFVLLTVVLRQKGSPESRELEDGAASDEDPRTRRDDPAAPWPVRRGGLVLAVYQHSLTIALTLLFLGSFALHAYGGAREYSEEQLARGGAAVGAMAYVGTARFWFESFQNWQSEFLSVGVLIVLSIVLRQRGSAQSKPVAAPHDQTGVEGDDERRRAAAGERQQLGRE